MVRQSGFSRPHGLLRRFDAMVLSRVNRWIVRTHPEMVRGLRKARRRQTGKGRVDIAVPRTVNEKFAWRKIFDHDPRFTVLSDKVACKDWVRRHFRDVRMPKTLWTGTDASQIPWQAFNTPSVIKARHGCKMNIFLREPSADRDAIIAEANAFVGKRHGEKAHEWAYYDVPSGLIVEELLFAGGWCFDVKIYTFGREIGQVVPIYTRGDQRNAAMWLMEDDGVLHLSDEYTAVSDEIDQTPLPQHIDEMLAIASEIGAHFDHMRVDFLCNDTEFFLGELTVYNLSGKYSHHGFEEDYRDNRLWDIRRSRFLSQRQRGWRGIYQGALRRELDRIAAAGG